MTTLQLSDASLYYEVHEVRKQSQTPTSSHTPPLMLVAGLASDSQSWQPVLDALTRERRVILLDNRASGRTQAPAAVSLTQMAQDCLALCDHLKIDKVDLLGHSMGGFVSLNVARLAPDRIGRLVLCNSSARINRRNELMFTDWADALDEHGATARWYRTFFYWILTRGFFTNDQALQQLLNLVMSYEYAPKPVTYRSQVQAIEGFDASDWLAEIETETLVLTTSEDLIFPPGDDAAGLAALPNAQVQIVPGLAHSLPMEAPKVFCEKVLGFL